MRFIVWLATSVVLTAGIPIVTRAQAGQGRALAIARSSARSRTALHAVEAGARRIRDQALREAVVALLRDPRPTFMDALATAAAREEARRALVAASLLDPATPADALFPPLPGPNDAPLSFLAAPAQALGKHHAYPGGLAQHTAWNLDAARGMADAYAERFDVAVDRDVVTVAVILHDVMKAWCLQWQSDGSLTVQAIVAGTASHHPFAVAEAIHRGLPPRAVIALASAHDAPFGETAPRVIAYVRAGAILAGVDPIAHGLLRTSGGGLTLARPAGFEAAIDHLSDHDFVLTDPTAHLVSAELERLVAADPAMAGLDEGERRWAVLAALSIVTGPRLYAASLEEGGIAALLVRRGLRFADLAATSRR